MKNVETTDRVRVVSYKQQATTNLSRALEYFKAALSIDPTMAAVVKGDLTNKINDSQQQLNVLLNPVPLPMTRESPSGRKFYN